MPSPTQPKRSTAKLAIAALIALLATFGLITQLHHSPEQAAANDPATAQAVQTFLASTATKLDGQPQALSQWRDRIIVVNYWATWCPPCRQEMPALSRLSEQFSKNGVQFVGIAIDSADNVRKFVANNPSTYPLLLGSDDAMEQSRALGNRKLALPFTAVIDRHGVLRLTHLGAIDEKEFAAHLSTLAAAP